MGGRVLIAGIIGGILVFCTGAVNHMVFQLQGRTLSNIPDSASFTDDLKSRGLRHGLYVFPDMPAPAEHSDAAKMAALNERYKVGPSGMLLIVHTGEDLMNLETLGKELATNIVAACMAAWVVSLVRPDVGFVRRWQAVLFLGAFAWISIAASYGIWYRFPHDFLHDELFCALLEWGVGGLAIAAIVRQRPVSPAAAADKLAKPAAPARN
jgi:hypothetical protein